MLTFNDLLAAEGVGPASVRLLRHQEHAGPSFPSPYVLWRDDRAAFERYQSHQAIEREANLRAPLWASFVAVPPLETLFVGLYEADLLGLNETPERHPIVGRVDPRGHHHVYRCSLSTKLERYIGRLWIDWGPGYRSWIQRGDGRPKPIVELRRAFDEPTFPGFSRLVVSLSELPGLPASWSAALSATHGVYLLTCPRTKEQYVGSAYGEGGLLARWNEYLRTGHGGNVALKSREPSDYQVSILETLGTGASLADTLAAEDLWKRKLQSREMGLNRN